MSIEKHLFAADRQRDEAWAAAENSEQVQFERLTVSIIGDAEEIAHIDKLTNLEVGPVELTSINNAITKLQAFVLKHRRKVAA